MRAARSEFDHGPSLGCRDAARGFGGDQRGESDGRKQVGFGDLGFDDGRAEGEHRLAGEERRAFRDGEQIAGEAEGVQVVEELGRRVAELRQAAEVGDFFIRELQVQQIIDGLRQPGGDDEVAVRGQAADGELERRDLIGFAGLEISRRHGELVEIGEKGVHIVARPHWACAGARFAKLSAQARRPAPLTSSSRARGRLFFYVRWRPFQVVYCLCV